MSKSPSPRLTKVAEADFPTEFGLFRIFGFEAPAGDGSEEAVVLKMGDFLDGVPPLVRIHSQCLTGDVFRSLRCDCRAQLEIALTSIARGGGGLLLSALQEGRGIGLLNKLRAYELQDQGADTIEANQQLGFDSDLRNYQLPGEILEFFGLRAVRLMSNNPDQVATLKKAAIPVVDRVPCRAAAPNTRLTYLRPNREKMGHLLEFDAPL